MTWEFDAEVETKDWIGDGFRDLASLWYCVNRLQQDLASDFFARWEIVVRREQDLPPVEILSGLFLYRDPHEIRDPRPTLSWYTIVQQVAERMLFDPFDPADWHQRQIALDWPRLAALIEEHGYGLSLPAGVTAPLDVAPAGLRQRLWE